MKRDWAATKYMLVILWVVAATFGSLWLALALGITGGAAILLMFGGMYLGLLCVAVWRDLGLV